MERDLPSDEHPLLSDTETPMETFPDQPGSDFEEPEESAFSRYLLPAGLFALTVFTTLWAGAYQDHPDLFHPFRGAWTLLTERPGDLVNGIPFALTLLLSDIGLLSFRDVFPEISGGRAMPFFLQ